MAGGKNAETVVCMVCMADDAVLTPAERTYEGDETDEYRCEKGHTFSMDWSAGEADMPQWPPSQVMQDFVADEQRRKQQGAR